LESARDAIMILSHRMIVDTLIDDTDSCSHDNNSESESAYSDHSLVE